MIPEINPDNKKILDEMPAWFLDKHRWATEAIAREHKNKNSTKDDLIALLKLASYLGGLLIAGEKNTQYTKVQLISFIKEHHSYLIDRARQFLLLSYFD